MDNVLGRFTSLVRTVDPRHGSNVFAVIASVVVGAGALIWQLVSGGDDVWQWGLAGLGGAYIAWAIARELDPDQPWSAGIALVASVGFLFIGRPGLILGACAIVALRIVLRPTGNPMTWLDVIGVVALGWAVGLRPSIWPVAIVLIVATLWDLSLPRPGPWRGFLVVFGVAGTTAAAAYLYTEPELGWIRPGLIGWILVAVLVLIGYFTSDAYVPISVGDDTGEPLDDDRLAAARLIALGTGIAIFLWLGNPGLGTAGPVWAAILGAAVGRFLEAPGAEGELIAAEDPQHLLVDDVAEADA